LDELTSAGWRAVSSRVATLRLGTEALVSTRAGRHVVRSLPARVALLRMSESFRVVEVAGCPDVTVCGPSDNAVIVVPGHRALFTPPNA
jgi:hypothetical protein